MEGKKFNFLKKHFPNVRFFWVAEPNDSKYSYHTHALLRSPNDQNVNQTRIMNLIKKAWQSVSGGRGGKEYNYTVLKPYMKDLGANYYVSKYMLRSNADYDILFENRGV